MGLKRGEQQPQHKPSAQKPAPPSNEATPALRQGLSDGVAKTLFQARHEEQ
jgi:hypothetical protein